MSLLLDALKRLPSPIYNRLTVDRVFVELGDQVANNAAIDQRITELLVHANLLTESHIHNSSNLFHYVYWQAPAFTPRKSFRVAPPSLFVLLRE